MKLVKNDKREYKKPIQMLDWDSSFFGKKIGRTRDATNLGKEVNFQEFELIYLYADRSMEKDQIGQFLKNSAFHISHSEKKIDYEITIDNTPSIQKNIKSATALNDTLIDLAIQSGRYSRFKLCPILSSQFERFYSHWISQSITRKMADEVFIYQENELPLGLVTCIIDADHLRIGLIAVSEKARGKGIGRKLIETSCNFASTQGLETIRVSTQGKNQEAMLFYQSLGFKVRETEYLYHISNENSV